MPSSNDQQHHNKCLRRLAIVWLSIWLLLSVARQAFDLLGKLWALLLFDLVQVLALCSGLFALSQRCRNGLYPLPLLGLFSLLSMAYNVALLLWWCTELLSGSGRKEEALAFGLPFGHSFFLRHSPFCSAHFNLTTHRWEQAADCAMPYSYFEGLQAILHALLATGTFVLSLALFFIGGSNDNGNNDQQEFDSKQQKKTGSLRPSTDEHILARSPPPLPIPQMLLGANKAQQQHLEGSSQEISGYLNSLYEERGVTPATTAAPVANNGRPRLAPIPPIRRSFPRRKDQQQQQQKGDNWGSSAGGKGKKQQQQHHQLPEHYSSLSTADCGSIAMLRAKSLSSRSSSDDSASQLHQQAGAGGSGGRERLYSPYYSRPKPGNQRGAITRDGGASRASLRTFSSAGQTSGIKNNDNSETYYKAPSALVPSMASTNNAPLSPPQMSSSPQPQQQQHPYCSSAGPQAALRRGAGERRSSSNVFVTSLVSFDPKASGGQLMRVREHRTSSSEEEEEPEEDVQQLAEEEEEEEAGKRWPEDEQRRRRQRKAMMANNQRQRQQHFVASQDSIPSTDAPERPQEQGCAAANNYYGLQQQPQPPPLPPLTPVPSRLFPPMPGSNGAMSNGISQSQSSSSSPAYMTMMNNNGGIVPVPLRQRVLPPPVLASSSSAIADSHQKTTPTNIRQQHFVDHNDICRGTSMPTELQGNNAALLPPANSNGRANTAAAAGGYGCYSSSIYDTFVANGPQEACRTSFPVQQGAQPWASSVQLMGAASAIRLSRQDLSNLQDLMEDDCGHQLQLSSVQQQQPKLGQFLQSASDPLAATMMEGEGATTTAGQQNGGPKVVISGDESHRMPPSTISNGNNGNSNRLLGLGLLV